MELYAAIKLINWNLKLYKGKDHLKKFSDPNTMLGTQPAFVDFTREVVKFCVVRSSWQIIELIWSSASTSAKSLYLPEIL